MKENLISLECTNNFVFVRNHVVAQSRSIGSMILSAAAQEIYDPALRFYWSRNEPDSAKRW